MRIGSSLILKAGNVVQSYGWTLTRPFGSLNNIVKHLDDYQCDEIAILRYVREQEEMCRFISDIEQLKKIYSSSPISFGGGIRDKSQISMLLGLPVERIIYSSAFLSHQVDILKETIAIFGRQAVLGLLPIYTTENGKYICNLATGEKVKLGEFDFSIIDKYANEVIIYDIVNEGRENCFNFNILQEVPSSGQR